GFSVIEVTDIEGTPAVGIVPEMGSRSASSTLRGEIIDPKCHSGAMKPGDGKAHKACAVLCLRGGIPPIFLDDSGARYLLLDEGGNALHGESLDAILPFVGDRVEVRGSTSASGDLKFLQTDVHQIRRLTPS